MPRERSPNSLLIRNLADRTQFVLRSETTVERNLTVFVCRADDLREAFSRFGDIRDVYLPLDFHTKRRKGFAFVEFAELAEAEAAQAAMDRMMLDERELQVELAQKGRKTADDMRYRGGGGDRHGDRRHDDRGPPRRYDDRRYDDRGPPRRYDDRRHDDRGPPRRYDDRRHDDRGPPRRYDEGRRSRSPRGARSASPGAGRRSASPAAAHGSPGASGAPPPRRWAERPEDAAPPAHDRGAYVSDAPPAAAAAGSIADAAPSAS